MAQKTGTSSEKPQRTAADVRQERLKAALKANMAKRKAQVKERARERAAPDGGSAAPNKNIKA